ncbi:MAG: KpsF/GutQ family sugar-phosphate isomerase [Candidatus Aminicenantes bacterium]|nr:KpsF/GutQ family sugar-phosphate isomerase [Candidatus Aminicenantes bacterium]
MTKKDIIETGREVLTVEARAVEGLVGRLGEDFARAVEMLSGARSRVIVTGMGKSGLVGRKMAATLASCGTPAMFVHPAEAGHGDLGMLLKEDVLLAVSYSGETKEIVTLLDYFKRIGVRLISITGNRNSRIARYSDIVLDAKVEREAGPSNIVPTASSTAALALGDALAIALMRKKGFGERDFARVHPKGQIGKRLLRVGSLMRRGAKVPLVATSAPMSAVIEEMTAKQVGMTCVVDAERTLVGIITDGDLRRLLRTHRARVLKMTAGDCMKAGPVTVGKMELATEALNLMEAKRITSLVIMGKDGRVEGVIHLHDLWRTEMF